MPLMLLVVKKCIEIPRIKKTTCKTIPTATIYTAILKSLLSTSFILFYFESVIVYGKGVLRFIEILHCSGIVEIRPNEDKPTA